MDRQNNFRKIEINISNICKYNDFIEKNDFNELNNTLGLTDQKKNILDKFINKTYQYIVTQGDKPVFFIRYYTSSSSYYVDTMLFDKDIIQKENLEFINYLKENIFISRSFLSRHVSFIYNVAENENNKKVLESLGFVSTDTRVLMKIEKNDFKSNHLVSPNFSIVKVHSKRDIEARVRVQNDIFNNKDRIPLEYRDVENQMKHSSYLEDLSLLLLKDGKDIGYGQIVLEKNNYYLVNFGIIKKERGNGYSDILLDMLLTKTFSGFTDTIFLEVFEDNNKAIGLYLKHGFRIKYRKSTYKLSKN